MSASVRTTPTITLLVLAIGAASFTLLQSLLNPVLRTIQSALDVDQTTVAWVLIAWVLSASIATPIMGRIGDMIGKKRTLVIALSAVALGSLIGAIAPTFAVLVLARVVQGFGGAIVPLAYGIIRDEMPRERVAPTVGIMSAVIAIGSGLGLVLAGPIVTALGWRWLFWIPLIVGAATAAIAAAVIPESPTRAGGRINPLAAVLLSGWLVALMLPLNEGGRWGWGSPLTVGLLVLAALLLASWITVEVRSANPMIDMRMMRLPAVWTANLVTLLFGAGMFAAFGFLPLFAETPTSAGYGFGATVTGSGLLLLPLVLGMAVSGFFSGPLTRFVGTKTQLIIGSVFTAVSCAAIALLHETPLQVGVEGAIYGLGLGVVYAALANLIVAGVPASQTSAASGMNANIRNIGGAIGAAVASSIITSRLEPSGLPIESGYTNGFLVLAAFGVAAVAFAFLVPSARRRRAATAPVASPLASPETEPAAEPALAEL